MPDGVAMTDRQKCSHCGSVAVGSDGLCKPCRIEESDGPEAKRHYMAELGRRGAKASRRGSGLDAEALGALDDHSDAKRWLRLIGEAVITGRLSNRDAQAGVKAVEAWLKAHGESVVAKDVAELREALDGLRKRGKLKALP